MASRKQADSPAEHAPLVFIGHVAKAKAATLAGIAAADTAIVAVDHVVQAPALFTTIGGTQITVRFGRLAVPPVGARGPSSPRAGSTARGWRSTRFASRTSKPSRSLPPP